MGCTVLVVEIRIAGAFLRYSGITAAELSDIFAVSYWKLPVD